MGNSEVVKLKTPLGQSDGKHKGPDPQAQDTTAIGQSDWKLKGRGDGANPSSGSTTHEAVSDKLRSYKEEAKRLRQELHSLRMGLEMVVGSQQSRSSPTSAGCENPCRA